MAAPPNDVQPVQQSGKICRRWLGLKSRQPMFSPGLILLVPFALGYSGVRSLQ
jgi:hypothetical protein